jgi:hypothetical protein
METLRARIFIYGWSLQKALNTDPNLYHNKI